MSSINKITIKVKTDVTSALNNFIHNSLGNIEGNIVLGLSAQERNELISQIPEVKIYATRFTKFSLIEDGVNEKNIVEIIFEKEKFYEYSK